MPSRPYWRIQVLYWKKKYLKRHEQEMIAVPMDIIFIIDHDSISSLYSIEHGDIEEISSMTHSLSQSLDVPRSKRRSNKGLQLIKGIVRRKMLNISFLLLSLFVIVNDRNQTKHHDEQTHHWRIKSIQLGHSWGNRKWVILMLFPSVKRHRKEVKPVSVYYYNCII